MLRGPLGPSTPQYVRKPPPKCPRPPKAPQFVHLGRREPQTKTDHILGYVAQNAISRAPNPPATTHFWWFPALKIALTDAYTPALRPSGLRQAARGSPKTWVAKWVNKVHRLQKKKRLTLGPASVGFFDNFKCQYVACSRGRSALVINGNMKPYLENPHVQYIMRAPLASELFLPPSQS